MLSELTTIKQNYFAKKVTRGEEESEAGVSGTLLQVGLRWLYVSTKVHVFLEGAAPCED